MSRRGPLGLPKTPEMDTAARILSLLYLGLQTALILAALWPTCAFILWARPIAGTPFRWALLVTGAVMVFNYAYLVALLMARLIIPKPKEGFYPCQEDGRPPPEGFLFLLNAFLVMARYRTPWAAIFSSVMVNTIPLSILYRRFFGPKTSTVLIGDLCNIMDPYLLEAGRNVMFGTQCTIGCHIFDHRGLRLRKVRIGDHAILGGFCDVMLADVGHHAIVAAHSWVLPDTVIGPYELWSGSPAKKIKDLTPKEYQEAANSMKAQ